jgi:hypothetical protein
MCSSYKLSDWSRIDRRQALKQQLQRARRRERDGNIYSETCTKNQVRAVLAAEIADRPMGRMCVEIIGAHNLPLLLLPNT